MPCANNSAAITGGGRGTGPNFKFTILWTKFYRYIFFIKIMYDWSWFNIIIGIWL